ncbi:hypothetical protein L207DRAFT_346737 [Hyaloscypha variabilis F]|uniref:Secreted protein n=1 Tax=Hyaloscypha variabilis (strain UAMH 11265 / GT02V1 / F) TaxID=1149755 RepID=A0A2J6RQR9_HYAVF|nr:hypothetical protein L207DRAFT_346737 [Hyaloscypha variabilis F]
MAHGHFAWRGVNGLLLILLLCAHLCVLLDVTSCSLASASAAFHFPTICHKLRSSFIFQPRFAFSVSLLMFQVLTELSYGCCFQCSNFFGYIQRCAALAVSAYGVHSGRELQVQAGLPRCRLYEVFGDNCVCRSLSLY